MLQACDREFKTQRDYNTHMESHVDCPVPGCKFRGARRVVNIHRDEAHGNKKVRELTTRLTRKSLHPSRATTAHHATLAGCCGGITGGNRKVHLPWPQYFAIATVARDRVAWPPSTVKGSLSTVLLLTGGSLSARKTGPRPPTWQERHLHLACFAFSLVW